MAKTTTTSKKSRSRRASWPERERENGEGEFHVTTRRLVGFVSLFLTVGGAFPLYWALSDHWMNKTEIEKALKEQEKSLKAHADHDEGVQQWVQYGLATNRLEYIDDKMAECEAKKMIQSKLKPDEAVMCGRYEAKQKSKQQEAAALKDKAMEATKEKK